MSIAKAAIGLGMLGLGSAFVKKSKQAFVPRSHEDKVDLKKLPRGRVAWEPRPEWAARAHAYKPYPAFWTSSVGDGTTEWVNWCRTEMPHWIAKEAAVFEVDPNAKILDLNDEDQVSNAKRRYGVNHESGGAINWTELHMSGEYDGITCDPYKEGEKCPWGWDAESTAWINMNALKLVGVVDINKVCSVDSDDPTVDDWERKYATTYTLAPIDES